MRSVNKVILVGKVGKNPEIRQMQNGKDVASFSVATSERWLDRTTSLYKEKTDWHNIVVFSDPLVKITKDYVRKGSSVYIEGAIKTREYVDKDGKKRYVTEIHIPNFSGSIVLLDSQRSQGDRSNSEQSDIRETSSRDESGDGNGDGNGETYQGFMDDFTDDEIPF